MLVCKLRQTASTIVLYTFEDLLVAIQKYISKLFTKENLSPELYKKRKLSSDMNSSFNQICKKQIL